MRKISRKFYRKIYEYDFRDEIYEIVCEIESIDNHQDVRMWDFELELDELCEELDEMDNLLWE